MSEFYNLTSELLVPAADRFPADTEAHLFHVGDLSASSKGGYGAQIVQSHQVHVLLVNAKTAADIPAALEADKQNMLKAIETDPALEDSLGRQVKFVSSLQDMMGSVYQKEPDGELVNIVKDKMGQNYDTGQLVMLSGISGFSKSTP